MKTKIINKSKHLLPRYATIGSAGMDIHADLDDYILLMPMQRVLIPTGLHIELPKGREAQIRPRSGLALKHGITVLNSPSTIDSDYRGAISVLLINLSNEPCIIDDGDRIAQLVIAAHDIVEWEEVDVLTETVRGNGGFGHTGRV